MLRNHPTRSSMVPHKPFLTYPSRLADEVAEAGFCLFCSSRREAAPDPIPSEQVRRRLSGSPNDLLRLILALPRVGVSLRRYVCEAALRCGRRQAAAGAVWNPLLDQVANMPPEYSTRFSRTWMRSSDYDRVHERLIPWVRANAQTRWNEVVRLFEFRSIIVVCAVLDALPDVGPREVESILAVAPHLCSRIVSRPDISEKVLEAVKESILRDLRGTGPAGCAKNGCRYCRPYAHATITLEMLRTLGLISKHEVNEIVVTALSRVDADVEPERARLRWRRAIARDVMFAFADCVETADLITLYDLLVEEQDTSILPHQFIAQIRRHPDLLRRLREGSHPWNLDMSMYLRRYGLD